MAQISSTASAGHFGGRAGFIHRLIPPRKNARPHCGTQMPDIITQAGGKIF